MAEHDAVAKARQAVRFETRDLSWATGTEVRGIDLTRPQDLSDADVDALGTLRAAKRIEARRRRVRNARILLDNPEHRGIGGKLAPH